MLVLDELMSCLLQIILTLALRYLQVEISKIRIRKKRRNSSGVRLKYSAGVVNDIFHNKFDPI